ncbi:MAG: hypothetical protein AAFP86_19995, partial [Planctomycetota bacterium]
MIHDARQAGIRVYAAAAATEDGTLIDADCVGCLHRHTLGDVGSSAIYPFVWTSQPEDYGDFETVGVLARVSGGTRKRPDEGWMEYQTGPDGYALLHVRRPTAELIVLVKFGGATATILRFEPIASVDTANGTYPSGQPRFDVQAMRIATRRVGSNVEIRCFRARQSAPGSQPLELWPAITDSTDAHVASGYGGMVMSSPRTRTSGSQTAPTISTFDHWTNVDGGGQPAVRDTFERPLQRTLRVQTDLAGGVGFSLHGGWTGDVHHASDVNSIAGSLQAFSGNEASIGSTRPAGYTPSQLGFYTRQVTEPSASQRARAVLQLRPSTSTRRDVGVFVRGSFFFDIGRFDLQSENVGTGTPNNADKRAYVVKVVRFDDGSRVLQLTRIDQPFGTNGRETILGTRTGLT